MPGISAEQPLAVIAKTGSRRWVAAAAAAALKAGVRPGMPAAKAQALFQGLMLVDEDPAADAAALERIGMWMLSQYSPVVATDGVDGVVMDTEGADHLQGGEELMVSGLANRLRARGLTVRVAIADTWGAAWACARAIRRETVVVPRGGCAKALEKLPVSLLRLPGKTVEALRVLGFDTIGQLSATPRAPLALRFGPEIGRRLDQAYGRMPEPVDPIRSPEVMEVKRSFAEPIGSTETVNRYVSQLVTEMIDMLRGRGLSVRRADLLVEKVDGARQAIRAGTAKPCRDAVWLTRLFHDRTDRIDAGFGIERLVLRAVVTEPLEEVQTASGLVEEAVTDITPLIDLLGNRGQRVFRCVPVASDVPERSVARADPTAEVASGWPVSWPRPVRLLPTPEPVEVMALLPDHPPVTVTWRGKRRKVARADGPERVFGEWWKREAEMEAVRDYFMIEDEQGGRFWIFRSGDGVDPETGSHRWFMHGLFA